MSISQTAYNNAIAAMVADITDIATQRATVVAAITGNMGSLTQAQQSVAANLLADLDRHIAQTMLVAGLGPVFQANEDRKLHQLTPKDQAIPTGMATEWSRRLTSGQFGAFA